MIPGSRLASTMSTREFENYLALLVRLMPVDAVEREAIREELRSHLEVRYDELLAQKVPPAEALRQAIDELGDAARLAAAFVSLSRTQRRRRIMRFSSATLVAAVLCLLALTVFWPTNPPGGPAAFQAPVAIAQAQAQAPPVIAETSPRKSDIQQRLSRPIEAEFVETPLQDVLSFLADKLQIQFHVNRRALTDAAVDIDTQVSIYLKQVKADTVLRLVLQSVDPSLDFVERDGFVLVSTIEDLDRVTEVRVYNCRDLLSLAPPAPGGDVGGGFDGGLGPMGPPAASGYAEGMGGLAVPVGLQPTQSRLIGLIMDSVESSSWDTNGGVGSISEFNGLLVVKQSARVHEKVEDLLNMLRKAADLKTAE